VYGEEKLRRGYVTGMTNYSQKAMFHNHKVEKEPEKAWNPRQKGK